MDALRVISHRRRRPPPHVRQLVQLQYVFDIYGKFPGSFNTIVLPGFVQAVHLDTEFYDEHYRDGAYLETHAEHMRRWHG